MTHINRSRITVTLGGNWRLYTNTLPASARPIGTVNRDDETGALVLMPTGLYVQINAGAIRSLDQRKVRTALGINDT